MAVFLLFFKVAPVCVFVLHAGGRGLNYLKHVCAVCPAQKRCGKLPRLQQAQMYGSTPSHRTSKSPLQQVSPANVVMYPRDIYILAILHAGLMTLYISVYISACTLYYCWELDLRINYIIIIIIIRVTRH